MALLEYQTTLQRNSQDLSRRGYVFLFSFETYLDFLVIDSRIPNPAKTMKISIKPQLRSLFLFLNALADIAPLTTGKVPLAWMSSNEMTLESTQAIPFVFVFDWLCAASVVCDQYDSEVNLEYPLLSLPILALVVLVKLIKAVEFWGFGEKQGVK